MPGKHSYGELSEVFVPQDQLFVAGVNKLQFIVVNGRGKGGLYVEGSVVLDCAPPPAPPPWEERTADLGTGKAHWEGMQPREDTVRGWYPPAVDHAWLGSSTADQDLVSTIRTTF